MSHYTHSLTAIEEACGVTLDQVAEMLPKCRVFDNGTAITLPANTGPALAGSVARCAFGGKRGEFSGMALGTLPTYRTA